MERERRDVTCAHHGCYSQENNLEAAQRVLREHREIGVMEIDFCEYRGAFISAHDPTPAACANGSPLAAWVAWLCVRKRRTLYLDLKAHYSLKSWWWTECKFNVEALLGELVRLRAYFRSSARKHPVDIARHIWLTSQDQDVAQRLAWHCRGDDAKHWIVIADVPFMGAYVRRYTTPSCWQPALNQTVTGQMLAHHYDAFIVAIDCSFLGQSLEAFVRESSIRPGSTLILYAFELNQPPVELAGYTVIMMYNYRLAL